ncbi:DUF2306 domain-containing protein [Parvularcula maris]|uniref:DUF2306 domain-containing protein n=1 Tax=Parvularcula maris TaxID=2965077 RepID=A0A9X2L9S0_9PROT|nr:DUF2306 domain-containing protein [Parvularcula maris]MCQ8185576.1 DUF2306 domain-containing protein [Parvularcula maris]
MNWEVFTRFSGPEIQLHWATVTIAFVAGLLQLLLSKGTPRHVWLGRLYAVMMIATSIAAFFIRSGEVSGLEYLSLKGMSWIHIFIPITLTAVPLGVLAARRGDIRSHKGHMIGSYIGAILIAGVFTFVPGRRMHLLFFADQETIERLETHCAENGC